jgi:hypothetical protein
MQTISDPTLTYLPSIAFIPASAVPENPAAMIPVLLAGIALLRRWRKAHGDIPA